MKIILLMHLKEELHNPKRKIIMNYLFLASLFLVSFSFSGPRNKTKKKTKQRPGLALEKTIHKKLIKRITAQGTLLSFVDEQNALVGNQFPIVVPAQSAIDWKRLAAIVTEPGRIAQSMDPEIEFSMH